MVNGSIYLLARWAELPIWVDRGRGKAVGQEDVGARGELAVMIGLSRDIRVQHCNHFLKIVAHDLRILESLVLEYLSIEVKQSLSRLLLGCPISESGACLVLHTPYDFHDL